MDLSIQAGQLRHRVTVQEESRTADGQGGFTSTWNTFDVCWASVKPLTGRELVHAQQVQAGLTHMVTIRYATGVTTGMRILFGARLFNIRMVRNVDERNVYLELLCEEGVGV